MAEVMVEGRVDNSPVKPTLNYEQAKALFDAECVFFGSESGVPVSRVAELFGPEPVEYIDKLKNIRGCWGKYGNEFWIKGFQCTYMYRDGFYQAVAYANVMRIAQAEGMK